MPKNSRPFYWLERVFWSLHSCTWDDHLQLPETQEGIQAMVAWLTSYRQHDNERVLDVGCGTGNYALALAEIGFDVVGVDFAPRMLKKARAKAAQLPQPSVTFEQADFNTDLRFPADSFASAICIHAFQCVADPPRFLREIRRVLRPDGLFLVVAVDSSQTAAPKKKLKTTLPRLIFWKLKALASKSRRVRKYTRDELMALLTSVGFDVVEERVHPGTIALMGRAQGR
jgi:ubiquinone/menaquinone biosynthesis C-methylase UbiE